MIQMLKRVKMVEYLNREVDDEKLSKKIEQSVYNYVIRLAKEENIQLIDGQILYLKKCIIQKLCRMNKYQKR